MKRLAAKRPSATPRAKSRAKRRAATRAKGAAAPRRRPTAAVAGADAVGVDTGGTFTDFVAWVDGRQVAFKLPSTPAAPERAVLEGLGRLRPGRASRVRYGSTVATNALLERKGARVALVATEGFEDLIEIGRQHRPDLYSLAPRRVEPLVPRARRIGVAERTGPGGETWRALTPAAIARTVARVRACRPEAVAVSLLHSYADAGNERRLGAALARLNVPVTLSSALCPEIREYERTATTVTNAYLAPLVARSLERLAGGTPARLEIVLSHGGTAPPALAAREPVRQLLSGPAAGLHAARKVALECGYASALTLDVGGTSTDCAFVAGVLPRRRGREVGGFPVQLPLLDVHTVGAGGGSIARVDLGGLLHVGPESAGAAPGPACYGRGGPATVTDALVVLGRLPLEKLAADLRLDPGAARTAIQEIARQLAPASRGRGRSRPPVESATIRAAAGVVSLAEANMAEALRRVSVAEGHDPRAAALVAFGGAGGLHACALADSLECRVVLFPRHAGMLSALGALTGGSRRERSRSVLLAVADVAARDRALRALTGEVRREFPAAERARLRFERWAEMRCRGQSHEIPVPVTAHLREDFLREHRRRYGFADPAAVVEVVTLEVRAEIKPAAAGKAFARARVGRGSASAQQAAAALTKSARLAGSHPATTPVHLENTVRRARLWQRAALPANWRERGPAIVAEEGATLWIPPGWSARIHTTGAVVVER